MPSTPTSRVTLIYGDSQLETAERVRSLRAALDPSALSTSIFENARDNVADVAAASGSPGFFGAVRVIIANNLLGGGTRRGRGRQASNTDDDLTFLSRVPDGVCVVLVEGVLSASDVKRIQKLVPDLSVQQCDVPRGRALVDWTVERAATYGATIDQRSATTLVEALFPGAWRAKARRDDVPPDLFRLDSEIAKLATASHPGSDITTGLIGELVPDADALNIWGLSNAIAERDARAAVRELESALDNAQAPEAILGQLTAQFETFGVLVNGSSRSLDALSSQSGLSEGRLRQAARTARQYRREDVAWALSEIRRVDFGAKQGLLEARDALSPLIVRLAERRARA